jgi:HPt (histidine-containing phosphotransfer) domain-containing protein
MSHSVVPASIPGVLSVPPAIPTLNQRRLDAIARDSSREFLVELAQLFMKDVEERIRCLASIIRSRDVTGTADAAHGVQSAAASLGVLRLRSLAATLEKHAEGEDWRRVESSLERIQSEFSHVKTVLQAMRETA